MNTHQQKQHLVILGGGHGPTPLLLGLKDDPRFHLTAIKPVTDETGSTGILRSAYGISGCTGDLVKSMAALCQDPTSSRAMVHRYPDGALMGHTIGNLMFATMQLSSLSLTEALERFHAYCGVANHRVVPVSEGSSRLIGLTRNGKKIDGEHAIETIATSALWDPSEHAFSAFALDPEIDIFPEAAEALRTADQIIFAPGSLLTSTVPLLLVRGVAETIRESRAPLIFVVNIMTEYGMTDGFGVWDFARQIEHLLGKPLDRLICNSGAIPLSVLDSYRLEHKELVRVPVDLTDDNRVRLADLWCQDEHGRIVHDPRKTAELLSICFTEFAVDQA